MHGVDAVVADYHLDNDENGLDLIDALREQSGSQLPGVLVTADQSTDLRAKAEERGVWLLKKPVRPWTA